MKNNYRATYRPSFWERIKGFFLKVKQNLIVGQYLLAVDIWEGQGNVDFAAWEAGGVSAVFIRLNNMAGGHHMDKMFTTYWNTPTSLVKIPYFVYNPWVSGQANYDWLAANCPGNMKAVLADIEVDYPGYSANSYAREVEVFKSLVRARWNTKIYTAEWFLPKLAYWPRDVDYWWAQYPNALYQSMTITWDRMRELLAPYTYPANAAKAPAQIKIWQCSGDKIKLPGSINAIDVNVLYMTQAELNAFAGVVAPPSTRFEPFDLVYTEDGVRKVQRFVPQ